MTNWTYSNEEETIDRWSHILSGFLIGCILGFFLCMYALYKGTIELDFQPKVNPSITLNTTKVVPKTFSNVNGETQCIEWVYPDPTSGSTTQIPDWK